MILGEARQSEVTGVPEAGEMVVRVSNLREGGGSSVLSVVGVAVLSVESRHGLNQACLRGDQLREATALILVELEADDRADQNSDRQRGDRHDRDRGEKDTPARTPQIPAGLA